jgi:hypothetical protein
MSVSRLVAGAETVYVSAFSEAERDKQDYEFCKVKDETKAAAGIIESPTNFLGVGDGKTLHARASSDCAAGRVFYLHRLLRAKFRCEGGNSNSHSTRNSTEIATGRRHVTKRAAPERPRDGCDPAGHQG